jgi:DNA polymerase-3 subunit gamma/tau
MGHIALYREWRPKTFDEIVEQSHTVAALRQAVLSGKIAHAYLFSGTRGTGKTTMAQVFSRAINCLSPVNGNPCNHCPVCTGILNGSVLDVIEMDAASNNSVDTIRRLCDEIVFTPSVAKFKVYIIDEVHMLSTGAFNALLKTLEEPPAHAVFILATTEQHRIPATILSRCQRYEFRRIPIASITERLRMIADADGVPVEEDALRTIAQIADGALRDAISLLDQAKGSFQGTIGKEDILSLVGVVNDDFMHQMALAIVNRDPAHAMRLVDEFILDGRDVIRFTMDLAAYFRNVMICNVTKKPEDLVYAPAKTINGMRTIAALLPLESLLTLIRQLSELVSDLRWSLSTRITFEVAVIRIMDSLQVEGPGAMKSIPPSVTVAEPAAPLCAESGIPAMTEIPMAEVDPPKPSVVPEELVSIPLSVLPQDPSRIELSSVWPKILDHIIAVGQMTVYLFLLPAKPVIADNVLRILFEDKDRLNYSELSTKQNHLVILQAVLQCTGVSIPVILGLRSEEAAPSGENPGSGSVQIDKQVQKTDTTPGETPSAAIDALKKSAEELGISFYMEENGS